MYGCVRERRERGDDAGLRKIAGVVVSDDDDDERKTTVDTVKGIGGNGIKR